MDPFQESESSHRHKNNNNTAKINSVDNPPRTGTKLTEQELLNLRSGRMLHLPNKTARELEAHSALIVLWQAEQRRRVIREAEAKRRVRAEREEARKMWECMLVRAPPNTDIRDWASPINFETTRKRLTQLNRKEDSAAVSGGDPSSNNMMLAFSSSSSAISLARYSAPNSFPSLLSVVLAECRMLSSQHQGPVVASKNSNNSMSKITMTTMPPKRFTYLWARFGPPSILREALWCARIGNELGIVQKSHDERRHQQKQEHAVDDEIISHGGNNDDSLNSTAPLSSRQPSMNTFEACVRASDERLLLQQRNKSNNDKNNKRNYNDIGAEGSSSASARKIDGFHEINLDIPRTCIVSFLGANSNSFLNNNNNTSNKQRINVLDRTASATGLTNNLNGTNATSSSNRMTPAITPREEDLMTMQQPHNHHHQQNQQSEHTSVGDNEEIIKENGNTIHQHDERDDDGCHQDDDDDDEDGFSIAANKGSTRRHHEKSHSCQLQQKHHLRQQSMGAKTTTTTSDYSNNNNNICEQDHDEGQISSKIMYDHGALTMNDAPQSSNPTTPRNQIQLHPQQSDNNNNDIDAAVDESNAENSRANSRPNPTRTQTNSSVPVCPSLLATNWCLELPRPLHPSSTNDNPVSDDTLSFGGRSFDSHEQFVRELGQVLRAAVELLQEYTQGMSYLGAMLLNFTTPESAFVLLCNLLKKFAHLPAFYTMNHVKMSVYFNAFKELLEMTDPDVGRRLASVGVVPEMYLVDWLMTLFLRQLPMPLCVRLWDLMLLDSAYLMRIALALLMQFELPLRLGDPSIGVPPMYDGQQSRDLGALSPGMSQDASLMILTRVGRYRIDADKLMRAVVVLPPDDEATIRRGSSSGDAAAPGNCNGSYEIEEGLSLNLKIPSLEKIHQVIANHEKAVA